MVEAVRQHAPELPQVALLRHGVPRAHAAHRASCSPSRAATRRGGSALRVPRPLVHVPARGAGARGRGERGARARHPGAPRLRREPRRGPRRRERRHDDGLHAQLGRARWARARATSTRASLVHLLRTERLDGRRARRDARTESGLLGVSGTSADMRDLLAREASDPAAADAVALFVPRRAQGRRRARRDRIDGLDTLVFSAGIGENAPAIRARICAGLGPPGRRPRRRRAMPRTRPSSRPTRAPAPSASSTPTKKPSSRERRFASCTGGDHE